MRYILLLYLCVFSALARNSEVLKKIAFERAHEAAAFFKNHSITDACFEFINNSHWSKNSVSMLLFESKGSCLVDNGYRQDLWSNFNSFTDSFYRPLLQSLLSRGTKGGWVSFPWLNSIKHVYSIVVPKDNREYIVSAGYYDESAPTVTQIIVNGIAETWTKKGFEKIKALVDDPAGIFVSGDIYGVIVTKDGFGRAYGGPIVWLGHDDMHDLANTAEQKFAQSLKHSFNKLQDGLWERYTEDGIVRKIFAKSYSDLLHNEPFIIYAGYYEISPTLVEECTHKICELMPNKSLKELYEELAKEREKMSVLCPGPLKARITTLDGLVCLETVTISHEGKLLQFFDVHNRVIDMLAHEQREEKGWVSRVKGSALEKIYYEKVKTADGECIVSMEGYFLRTPDEIAQAMCESAASQLKHHDRVTTCVEMIKRTPRYLRGDISTALYDFLGYCWIDTSFIHTPWYRDAELIKLPDGWVTDERDITQKLFITTIKKPEGIFKIVGRYTMENA